MSRARQTFEALLVELLADPSSAAGYALTAISFGASVEITLDKGGAMFVVWLRPAGDQTASYTRTARLKIGYRRDPPDRFGYALMDRVCRQVASWERSLGDEAMALFDATPAASASGSSPE